MLAATTGSTIGVDIEDIDRFEQLPYLEHESFYQKIFTKNEIAYCIQQKNPYPHFAVRFCAKEAFIKAINKKVSYQLMEVVKKGDQPFVEYNLNRYSTSLSHDKDKAIAVVIA